MDFFEWEHDELELVDPVLLVALEGWIDASGAAAQAVEVIRQRDRLQTENLIGTFDADTLLDFRARRPIMHLVDGVNTGLTWPSIELYGLSSPNGRDILLLTGAEPDHAWGAFADAVVSIAIDYECPMMVGLGAYPAATPHTRPVLLSATASSETLAERLRYIRGTLDVPAGIEAVLERRFAERDVPAVGLWAQVPHYISAIRYPAAADALIRAFDALADTDFASDELDAEIVATRSRIDALVEGNPQHQAMVRQLEQAHDEVSADAPPQGPIGPDDLPSGDDLAEELQRFLREQGG